MGTADRKELKTGVGGRDRDPSMDSSNSIAVTLAVRPALNVRLPAVQRPNCTSRSRPER
jgi:hypothetical protein